MPKGELGRYMRAVAALPTRREQRHVEQVVHRNHDHSVGHATD